MNNKNLLIIFISLLAIYGLSQVFSSKKDRSFKTELIEIDSTTVTAITINPKGPDNPEFNLTREENGWIASRGNINTIATTAAINALLSNLQQIKTQRVAAKSTEKWPDYEVEEGQGIRIKVYQGEKLMEDFIVGRFSFNQQNRSATSFIRISDQEEVYAVDGFMAMTLGQGFDAYRNKTMLKIDPQVAITEFAFEEKDTSYNFAQINGQWLLNNEIAIDSAKITAYLADLSNLTGAGFADDFDDLQADSLQFKRLTAKGNNLLEPIVITCYRDSTREKPFVLQSNYNEEAYFESDSAGIYQRIFKGWSYFVPE